MTEELKILEKKVIHLNQIYEIYKETHEINEIELKEDVYDVLSWIEICIRGIKFRKEHVSIISAIKHANNAKKHNASLYKCTKTLMGLYPPYLPSSNTYPGKSDIYWCEISLGYNENQFKNYNQFLLNKELVPSINWVFAIVKSYCS